MKLTKQQKKDRREKTRYWWDRPGWHTPYPGAWIEAAPWMRPVLVVRRLDGQIWEVITPTGKRDTVVEEQILKVLEEKNNG